MSRQSRNALGVALLALIAGLYVVALRLDAIEARLTACAQQAAWEGEARLAEAAAAAVLRAWAP